MAEAMLSYKEGCQPLFPTILRPQVSLAVFGDPQHFAFYIAFQLASGNAEAHVSKIVSHSRKIVHYLSTCPQLPPTTVSWLSHDLTRWMTLVGKQVRALL